MRAIKIVSMAQAIIGIFPVLVISIDNLSNGQNTANAAFCVMLCIVYATLIYALQYGITNKKYAVILQWAGFGLAVLLIILEVTLLVLLSQLH